jgi:hypothetical protein
MLLRRKSILSVFVSAIALSVCSALPATAQDQPQGNDEKSSSLAQGEVPENSIDETQIKLDRRTNSQYEKSAYSFRYKTQSRAEHKNYVDIVYSANGNLRINNHGGAECKIVDLGEEVGSGFDIRKVKKNDWQKIQIQPVTGHVYAYHVKVQQYQMTVLFRIDELSENQMGITAWYQKGKNRWPLSLANRGEAGTSGLNVDRRSAR